MHGPEDWGSITPLEKEVQELRLEVAALRAKLGQCFRGYTLEVRNELILDALHKQTEEMLEMPDLKEYLESRYDV